MKWKVNEPPARRAFPGERHSVGCQAAATGDRRRMEAGGCCAANALRGLIPFAQLEPGGTSVWLVTAEEAVTLVFPDGEFSIEPGGSWEDRATSGNLLAHGWDEYGDGCFRSWTGSTIGQFLGSLTAEEQAQLGIKWVRTET